MFFWEKLQSISTIALVAITAFYAWQTRKTVLIMKQTEDARYRPRVTLYIQQREDWVNFIDLFIVNNGEGSAKDVRFTIEKDLELLNKDSHLSQVQIIKNGLSILTPKQVLKLPLLTLIGRVSELKNYSSKVSIAYSDNEGSKSYVDEVILDFKGLIEHQLGTPPLNEMALALKKIEEHLGDINDKMKTT